MVVGVAAGPFLSEPAANTGEGIEVQVFPERTPRVKANGAFWQGKLVVSYGKDAILARFRFPEVYV